MILQILFFNFLARNYGLPGCARRLISTRTKTYLFQSSAFANNSRYYDDHQDKFIFLGTYEKRKIFNPISVLSFSVSSLLLARKKAAFATSQTIGAVAPTLDQQIIKRKNDDRDYLPFSLSNGLRVLLISDKATVMSGAAMDVHVGSLSDPTDLQGLAHFTEHMSFLGTKKFPSEGDFTDYLSSHGGSSNAYTASEDTVYYFDVSADFLRPSLERFAQFFTAPLFTASATGRELNAIESEHSKNINNDAFRLDQLERQKANPLHPFSHFATGNLQTLSVLPAAKGIDTRKRLLEFHNKYYSAPLMTLCVLGKQPLSEMQRWVEEQFSAVPDRGTSNPSLQWWGKAPPFLEMVERDAKVPLLKVVPVSVGSRFLSISWPRWVRSPEEREQLKDGSPSFVVEHLLGHESAGSLRSALVRRGWANTVTATVQNDDSDLQEFAVQVDLSEEGLRHWEDIVSLVFAYLRMLRSGGVPEYVFQELQQLSSINFDYAEKAEVSDYVSGVVANMQEHPSPKDYLAGGKIFRPEPCKLLLREFIDSLLQSIEPLPIGQSEGVRTTVCRVTLAAKRFEEDYKSQLQSSPYYGTQYVASQVNERTLRKWAGERGLSELHLPAPNPFIPSEFSIVASSADSTIVKPSEAGIGPDLIRRDEKWTLWFELDRLFKQPKVELVVSMALPLSLFEDKGRNDGLGALFVVTAKLFSMCLFQSQLNEQLLYDAGLAGLHFSLDLTSKGLQIVISGFSDKLPLFAERVCAAVRGYRPDEATFRRVSELLRRELAGWETQQPYAHCSYFASLASESLQYSIQDMRIALEKSTFDMQSDFLGKLLSGGSYGTALIMGNIRPQQAQDLLGIVERYFPFPSLPFDGRATKRTLLYPAASDTISGVRIARTEPNPNDVNSASTFYFQLPSTLASDYMPLELLSEVVQQPFYNSLRTQQQLGYIVFSGVRVRQGGVHYLTFTVQSSVANGARLTSLIEKFLQSELLNIVEKMDEKTLQNFKDGIIVRKLEPDKRLSQRTSRYWGEILAAQTLPEEQQLKERPLFDRAQIEVEALRKLTLKDWKSFAKNLLGQGSPQRRLLVTEMTAAVPPIPTPAEAPSNEKPVDGFDEIADVDAFVRRQPFL